ncbi:MAG: hypothetical protein N2560_01240 [Ignavibacteria bacterium]|nr:hypothetical protein [Ignavibacteria bacterium]
MKIKKFLTKTFQEGKEKILSELGPEAIILSSRVIPPFPPETEEMVELVAAIDVDIEKGGIDFKDENLQQLKKEKDTPSLYIELTSNIYKELSFIKNYLYEISDKITYYFISNLSSEQKDLVKLMIKNGFSPDFAVSYVQQFRERNFESLENLLKEATKDLSNKLTFGEFNPKQSYPSFNIFLGPSGTGKTLNIIKLAVLYKILLNANVIVVSLDYRKIGGWEQMQMLSAISTIHSILCQSNSELLEQINTLKTYDIILIDTSGGSPNDPSFLNEINEIINSFNWNNIVLVLSTTQSSLNFKKCVKKFKKFNPNYLMLTKFDEVNSVGHIYETLLEIRSEVPLLYFSTGTEIPNSIEPASPSFISKYLINIFE